MALFMIFTVFNTLNLKTILHVAPVTFLSTDSLMSSLLGKFQIVCADVLDLLASIALSYWIEMVLFILNFIFHSKLILVLLCLS